MEQKTAASLLLDGESMKKEELYGALVEDLYPPLNDALNAASILRALMEKDRVAPDSRELQMLDAIGDNLTLLSRLTNNIHDLALCGEEMAAIGEMEWSAQIRALVQIISPYAQREGAAVQWDGPRELWVQGDMALAERSFIWLLSSLIRTGLGEGNIQIGLKQEGESACLTLTDSRPCVGLGRAILDEGPLNSLNAEKKTGLYLTKEFCRCMGWTVKPLREGKSAGFCVLAPLAAQTGQLHSADETGFEEERRRQRVRQQMSFWFGRL